MNAVMDGGFLGLMRHASAWYDGMKGEDRSEEYQALTKSGVAATKAVARRLEELLMDAGVGSVTVMHVGTPQSEQTAEVLFHAMGPGLATFETQAMQMLGPEPPERRRAPYLWEPDGHRREG